MGYLLTLIAGIFIGWVFAHSVVADECRRLGSFYVGDTTYRCIAVEPRKMVKEGR